MPAIDPYYHTSDLKHWLPDCLEILKEFKSKSDTPIIDRMTSILETISDLFDKHHQLTIQPLIAMMLNGSRIEMQIRFEENRLHVVLKQDQTLEIFFINAEKIEFKIPSLNLIEETVFSLKEYKFDGNQNLPIIINTTRYLSKFESRTLNDLIWVPTAVATCSPSRFEHITRPNNAEYFAQTISGYKYVFMCIKNLSLAKLLREETFYEYSRCGERVIELSMQDVIKILKGLKDTPVLRADQCKYFENKLDKNNCSFFKIPVYLDHYHD